MESGVQSGHRGFLGGVPVTTSAQIDQAARELEAAYRDYQHANQDIDALPAIATQERAALIRRKVSAWNRLETARIRYEAVQERAARSAM
jgi:hypothetical protein